MCALKCARNSHSLTYRNMRRCADDQLTSSTPRRLLRNGNYVTVARCAQVGDSLNNQDRCSDCSMQCIV